jgi:predicted membrane protein
MKFHSSRGDSVRKYLANLFLGLCVIAVGIGYLGNFLDALPWSDFTLFFPGWGYLFLVIPSAYYLIRSPFSWFWPICLLIGVLGLISQLDIYPMDTLIAIGLAVLVILIGIRIILAPLFKRIRRNRLRKRVQSGLRYDGIVFTDSVESGESGDGRYAVSFGERSIRLDGQNFTSATLTVSFGEMKFDLSEACVTDCAVIDATCSFGELSIIVPDYARVEINKSGAFSDVSCKHPTPADESAPVVYINASCSFGEIVVR